MIAEPSGALVVGYGNALRSDDGFGWHVAGLLADDRRLAGTNVLRLHQLTPELALDVSRASFVVFVDAGRGDPGSKSVEPVGAADDVALSWTHHVAPAVLIALARDLYGDAPGAVAVSVGVASVEAGEQLSAAIATVVPEVVELVVGLVRDRAAAGTAATASARGA